ncbi:MULTISPECIES: GNAT family N-acetyltransferase [Bacillus]|uniref:GNAT family N-acetyltransferase n=1 Tax=Bacillus TaxID=1386 RepID=UPI000937AF63|nr:MULTISPECIES: GNAT family N-acetyltransferase [Bacillus]MBR9654999.1 N-acetyltransferase [Bacillus cereus]OKA31573.1 hypothetical protein BJR05_00080 [Bacillus cereus]PRP92314.1 hypothetical protein TUN_49480 [Bacillus sp. M21]
MWFRSSEKIRLSNRCELLEEENRELVIHQQNLQTKMEKIQHDMNHTINVLLKKSIIVHEGQLGEKSYYITCHKEQYEEFLKMYGLVSFKNSFPPDSVIRKNVECNLSEKLIFHSIYMDNTRVGRCTIAYDARANNICICELETLKNKNKGIGTKMLQYIINFAKKVEVRTITGSARPLDSSTTYDRLLMFYKKNGFVIEDNLMSNFKMELFSDNDKVDDKKIKK